jgi:hypothetical protein
MSHTFLSLDMNLIPQSTKDGQPDFWKQLFSNDNSRVLLDGYNSSRDLVHPNAVLMAWLAGEGDPEATLELILSDAVEYTREEYWIRGADISSIWYVEPTEVI